MLHQIFSKKQFFFLHSFWQSVCVGRVFALVCLFTGFWDVLIKKNHKKYILSKCSMLLYCFLCFPYGCPDVVFIVILLALILQTSYRQRNLVERGGGDGEAEEGGRDGEMTLE